jgi:benzoate/toluate 1,2-dioxygenase beta subunit
VQLLDRSFDVTITPVSGVEMPAEAIRGVEQFLIHEARLVDDRRLDAWLALWDEEGRYWVPRFAQQANPFEQVSLFWEDRMLREVRVRRVQSARNWSQQPQTRCSHLVGNIAVQGLDAAGHLIVRSTLHYAEWRHEQRLLAGTVHHKLVPTEDGGWRIRLKRVDLVNCDDVFANLEVFI